MDGARLKFRQVWLRLMTIYILLLPAYVLFGGFIWFLWEEIVDSKLQMIYVILSAIISMILNTFPPIASGKKVEH